jgi:hypothetical protein
VDATLRPEPAVGAPAVDGHGDALEPRLLARCLVHDLGRESVALRPAEIHPQQHLGPVGRFGAAGSGADREHRRAIVVLTVEQERRPLAGEVLLERAGALIELPAELRVGRLLDQLEQGQQVVRTAGQPIPELDLGPQAVGLPEDPLGGSLVIPEAGLQGQGVELLDAPALRV